jgi:superoxide dismutase
MKVLIFFAALLSAGISIAQTFTLPALPYSYQALEPFIDAQTMEIHHSKHHAAYVKNLNAAIGNTNKGLEEILLSMSQYSDAVRNNAGGHYNHSLFWQVLAPASGTQGIPESLLAAIQKQYGSLDSLKKQLNQAAATRFGSGWAWLVVTPEKSLKVCSSPNQDNPLMDISKDKGIPVLGIDVWEHAYYLKYQNKRADYLAALWSVMNWNEVGRRYEEALKSPLLQQLAFAGWQELKQLERDTKDLQQLCKDNKWELAKAKAQQIAINGKALTVVPNALTSSIPPAALKPIQSNCEQLGKASLKKTFSSAAPELCNSLLQTITALQPK